MSYSFIKISGRWYHLQNLKFDASRRDNTDHALQTLAGVAFISGGRVSTISRIICDGTPDGEGPATPGWLLPYVPVGTVSPRMMKAVYNRLIKLGYRPGRETKAFQAATR